MLNCVASETEFNDAENIVVDALRFSEITDRSDLEQISNGALFCHWIVIGDGDALSSGWIEPWCIERFLELTCPSDATQLDVYFGRREKDLDLDKSSLPGQIAIGVRGVSIRSELCTLRASPFDMLKNREGFAEAALRLARQTQEIVPLPTSEAKVSIFDADLYCLPLRNASSGQWVPSFRHKPIVSVEEVTLERVESLASDLANWLKTHVSEGGQLTYSYDPVKDAVNPGGNRIREWMAIYALLQAHEVYDDDSYANSASKAVGWQLSKHYHSHHDMGYIAEGKKVKLGAVALAALALNTPQLREKHSDYLGRLFKFTEYLWEESGGFHTFWRPIERDGDCQNFYPGEALLFWAVRWLDSRDLALWHKIYRSFEYYRSWHMNNRNPAFVPWHTQAYALLWRETRDEEMKSFIFEMNDWLVGIQQWEIVERYPDAMGRFYDPTRPFGPPHASSTGVYLEGLIEAYSVAKSLGDEMRMRRYAIAIKRGFRNVIQLQLNHPVEISRYPNPARAFGGVRTTEYDETVRIDNVQHNLIAALKIVSRKLSLSCIFTHDN